MRKPPNPLKYVLEDEVPLATNRPLHLLLPYVAALFGLLTYLTAVNLGDIVLQTSLVLVAGISLLFGYPLLQRMRFRSDADVGDEFKSVLHRAANRVSAAPVENIWLRKSPDRYIKAIKTTSDSSILISTSMLEAVIDDQERGEVLLAWKQLQVKDSRWLTELYLGIIAFAGIWAITAFELFPHFLGLLFLIVSIFGSLFIWVSAAAVVVLLLVVFAFALWYPDTTVFKVYEEYGTHPVIILDEFKSGKNLSKDEASQAISDLFSSEKKRRAERRAAFAFIASPIVTLTLLPLVGFNVWLGYLIAGGPFLIIMAVMTYWDDRVMRKRWGFLKEEEEPVWHDDFM